MYVDGTFLGSFLFLFFREHQSCSLFADLYPKAETIF